MLCMYFGFMGQILLCSLELELALNLKTMSLSLTQSRPVRGVEFCVWNTYILRVKIALAQMALRLC